MKDDDEFALTVEVPAEQWAFACRRVRFLEAAIVQILGDRGRLREWFSAPELASLSLPGLPTTRQGVARLAKAEEWRSRIVMRRGQEVREFHCAALPDRAFDGLIERVIAAPRHEGEDIPPTNNTLPAKPPGDVTSDGGNTTPPWVLPLMRVMRSQHVPSVESALRELPRHLPSGAGCPTLHEAMNALRDIGMRISH